MGGDTVDPACEGGFVDNGFAFAEKNGLCTEVSYSYIATRVLARPRVAPWIAQASVAECRDVPADSEHVFKCHSGQILRSHGCPTCSLVEQLCQRDDANWKRRLIQCRPSLRHKFEIGRDC